LNNKISAVIITKNEEAVLERCLGSLAQCDEIIVVDSGSTDNTEKIARSYGCRFIRMKWQGYARQKNAGIRLAKNEWILSVDADEWIPGVLMMEIRKSVCDGAYDAFMIARKNLYYTGKWLRFGGLYPDMQLRLFRKKSGRFDESAAVHESAIVKGAKARLKEPMMHETKRSIAAHISAVNTYTEMEADKLMKKGKKPGVYGFVIKPLAYFFKHYFLKAGFLDGWQGFVYHTISAWYVFISYVKLREKKAPPQSSS